MAAGRGAFRIGASSPTTRWTPGGRRGSLILLHQSEKAHRLPGVSASAAALLATLCLTACGTVRTVCRGDCPAHDQTRTHAQSSVPRARPQVVEPAAGVQAPSQAGPAPSDPVGDPNAHAPSLNQVRSELRLEFVAAKKSNATYIDPLRYVTVWGRTDQGVDATMPVGAPILAPCPVKILGVVPGWYAGQPLVYYELLNGPDAGRVQYVAEQITNIAPVGSFLQQGQVIARFAPTGTAIEFGWSTLNGITLARATTGYEEGQVTPAGLNIRAWLNALGANAGSA